MEGLTPILECAPAIGQDHAADFDKGCGRCRSSNRAGVLRIPPVLSGRRRSAMVDYSRALPPPFFRVSRTKASVRPCSPPCRARVFSAFSSFPWVRRSLLRRHAMRQAAPFAGGTAGAWQGRVPCTGFRAGRRGLSAHGAGKVAGMAAAHDLGRRTLMPAANLAFEGCVGTVWLGHSEEAAGFPLPVPGGRGSPVWTLATDRLPAGPPHSEHCSTVTL